MSVVMSTAFQDALQRWIKSSGLSQTDAAKILKVSRVTLSRMLNVKDRHIQPSTWHVIRPLVEEYLEDNEQRLPGEIRKHVMCLLEIDQSKLPEALSALETIKKYESNKMESVK